MAQRNMFAIESWNIEIRNILSPLVFSKIEMSIICFLTLHRIKKFKHRFTSIILINRWMFSNSSLEKLWKPRNWFFFLKRGTLTALQRTKTRVWSRVPRNRNMYRVPGSGARETHTNFVRKGIKGYANIVFCLEMYKNGLWSEFPFLGNRTLGNGELWHT